MARHNRPCPSDAFLRSSLWQSCQFRRRSTNKSAPSSRRLLHYVVDSPPTIPTVPIYGQPNTVFPVHRIYCVGGQNYGEKQVEKKIWGVRVKIKDPVRERPFFFLKPADAIVPCGTTTTKSATSGRRGRRHHALPPPAAVTTTANNNIPYPSATTNLRYEVELVVAMSSATTIYGYAVGVDLTRRDIQVQAKIQSRPWCSAKAFDRSAPISAIRPLFLTTTTTTKNGDEDEANNTTPDGAMWLRVNGVQRQTAKPRTDMIHSVTELIAALGEEFELTAGDLLYTGTPNHVVGPLVVGDTVTAGLDGVGELSFTMV
jgi:fumarylpyruvate hydrolase